MVARETQDEPAEAAHRPESVPVVERLRHGCLPVRLDAELRGGVPGRRSGSEEGDLPVLQLVLARPELRDRRLLGKTSDVEATDDRAPRELGRRSCEREPDDPGNRAEDDDDGADALEHDDELAAAATRARPIDGGLGPHRGADCTGRRGAQARRQNTNNSTPPETLSSIPVM